MLRLSSALWAMSNSQLVIIGLDGGSFDVLYPLFARGELPALQRLCDGGLNTELRSTLPPATMPAWTSFLTGASPAHHGVPDIFVHAPKSYTLVPASGRLRRLPTFLARLSRMGLRVASLGVPGTYPPEPTSGITISGFDAPGKSGASRDAVWPRDFFDSLRSLGGWRYATFNEQRGGRLAAATAALLADIEAKERIILDVYERKPWDVFFVHLQASDTAGHHLWHTFDKSSPRYCGPAHEDLLPSIYRRLDLLIERMLQRVPKSARVLVVSDHGMGGADSVAVHINRLLHQLGLLHFETGAAQPFIRLGGRALHVGAAHLPPAWLGTLMATLPPGVTGRLLALARNQRVDYANSIAFSSELDYAPAVWLNRQPTFPRGPLQQEKATAVADTIATALLEITHPNTGKRLLRAVHHRTEIASGAAASAFPDLLLEPAWPDGYRPSFLPSCGPGPVVRNLHAHELSAGRGSGMPGVHRREGIFVAYGPGLPAMQLPTFDIGQAGLFIYPLLGLSPPEDVDLQLPRCLHDIAATLGGNRRVPRATPSTPRAYAPEEATVVTERLRQLGYIE